MSFLNRVGWIFVSPANVFVDIREGRAPWWQPWLCLSLIYMVIGYLSMPIQLAVMETNPSNLTLDQLDQQIEMTEKFGMLQLLATPVIMLIIGLVIGGITYIAVSIMSAKATFKQYFSLAIFASLVTVPSQLISTLVLRARGTESIRSAEDAYVSISLRFLAPEDSGILKALLSTIEFFSIWSLVVLAMGLMAIFGLSRGQSIVAILPWWLISVVMALISQALGGLG